MRNYGFVAGGAVIGVLLRYGCMLIVSEALVLWIVNIAGSLAMGMLYAYFERFPNTQLKLLLTTGLLGSFTTFSAFSAEWLRYMLQSPLQALAYAFGMTICCVVAAFSGYWLVKRGERA